MSSRKSSPPGKPRRRPRARQGDGDRLREELVQAAIDLLSDAGSAEAVTLRAVARAVGIAAPSVYLHFADRESLLLAALIEADRRFALAMSDDTLPPPTPIRERFESFCNASMRFALEQRGAYHVLFSGVLPVEMTRVDLAVDEQPSSFQELYRMCADIVAERATTSAASQRIKRDPAMDLALEIWPWLHGYVSLRSAMPGFPWPQPEEAVASIVDRVFAGTRSTQP